MNIKSIISVVGLLAVSACGGGGGDPFSGLANETDFGTPTGSGGSDATDTVNSALALTSITGMPDANSVGPLFAAYEGPQSMLGGALGPTAVSQKFQHQLNTQLVAFSQKQSISWATFPDCVETDDATYVVFNNCEDSEDGYTGTLNGRIDVTEGHIVATIDMTLSGTGDEGSLDANLHIDGDITITDTSIVGRLNFVADATFSGNGQTVTLSLDSAVIYNVTLVDDCAVGGDIKVGVNIHISAGGQSEDYGAVGRAEFGPNCGDVTVYARSTTN